MSRRRKYIDVMKHPIALVIPRNEFISNKEIARRSRQSTRHAREAIALLAKDHCVISISQKVAALNCRNALKNVKMTMKFGLKSTLFDMDCTKNAHGLQN